MSETKKIVLPPPRPPKAEASIYAESNVKQILEDGLSVIATEVVKYKHRVNKLNEKLDQADARIITGYVKALVEMDKTLRQHDKDEDEDVAGLTDEELLAEQEKQAAVLRARIAAKKGNK